MKNERVCKMLKIKLINETVQGSFYRCVCLKECKTRLITETRRGSFALEYFSVTLYVSIDTPTRSLVRPCIFPCICVLYVFVRVKLEL